MHSTRVTFPVVVLPRERLFLASPRGKASLIQTMRQCCSCPLWGLRGQKAQGSNLNSDNSKDGSLSSKQANAVHFCHVLKCFGYSVLEVPKLCARVAQAKRLPMLHPYTEWLKNACLLPGDSC